MDKKLAVGALLALCTIMFAFPLVEHRLSHPRIDFNEFLVPGGPTPGEWREDKANGPLVWVPATRQTVNAGGN